MFFLLLVEFAMKWESGDEWNLESLISFQIFLSVCIQLNKYLKTGLQYVSIVLQILLAVSLSCKI